MIREDMKRAILNKNMLLALIISFTCLVVGGYETLFNYFNEVDFTYTYYFALSAGTASILALIFPLISILPYSRSYAVEYNSGYIYYYNNKISRRKYLATKILSCFISGGMAIGLPVLLFLLVCILRNGFTGESIGTAFITHNTELFTQNPVLYCVINTVNSFLCGGIFSLIGLFVSIFTKNIYLISVIPFGYYILGAIFFTTANINLNPILMFDINSYAESSLFFVTCYKLILLIITTVGFFLGGLHDAKKES